ncbi:MAG TPA: PAS domain S-box protein [bacterium]|nr:PAS domain S-box protein [bacterium]
MKNRQISTIVFTALALFCIILTARPVFAADDDLNNKRKIIIGTELDYPPYSFIDEKNNPAGFNVELTRAIAEVMDMDIVIKIGPWGDIRKELETGKIDAISGMYYSPERDKLVDFSSPYTVVHHAIFARSDSSGINSENDLRDKEIILMRGDIMHDYVKERALSGNPVLADSQADALRLLASGKHDNALLAKIPGLFWAKKLNLSNIVTVGPLLQPSKYCYAVKENETELLSSFNEGLAIIKETGSFDSIYDKWLGVLEPQPPPSIVSVKYVLIIVVPFLLILTLAIAWSMWLKKQLLIRKHIEDKLRENEEKFRIIFEQSTVGKSLTAPDGKLLSTNKAFADMLGYTVEELQELDFASLTHPDDVAESMAWVRDMLANKDVDIHKEKRYIHKNGSVVWTDVSTTLHRDDSGTPRYFITSINNITERKKMEQSLHAAGAYNRSLIEASLDPLVMIGPEGKITDVNRATEEATGYTREELIGTDFSGYFTEPEKADEGYRHVFSEGAVRDYKLEIKHRNGGTMSVLYNASVYSGEEGKPIGVFAAARDVTERIKSETALRASEEKYKLLIENLPQKIFIYGTESTFSSCNENFARDLKINADEIAGKSVFDFFPKELADKYVADNLELLKSGESKSIEEEYVEDGKKYWVQTVKTPLRDEAGNISGILGIFWDITERKEAQDKLVTERNRLLAILDGIDDVIYVADPKTYELLHVNEAFKKNWGEDVIGKICYKVLQNRDEPCPFCTNDIIFSNEYSGSTYVWEFQNEITRDWYRCADKAILWHDGRMVRFELAGNITEIKMAQRMLEKATQDLTRSNKELEQFAYVASHDLQEPLRMVSSYTQLLGRRYKDKLDNDANEFIEFAVDGATRMQRLINDLLAYSRVTTRGGPMEEIDTNTALAEALANLGALINETDAVITKDDMPRIPADYSQLVQVFQNLVGNAIKFKGDEPPRIHVSAELKDGRWEFSVSDNGIGIESEYKDRIFVIFQRLHAKSAYSGTGIGLALCKRIVERHGGKIWFESEPGKGSVFNFTLPAKGGR